MEFEILQSKRIQVFIKQLFSSYLHRSRLIKVIHSEVSFVGFLISCDVNIAYRDTQYCILYIDCFISFLISEFKRVFIFTI